MRKAINLVVLNEQGILLVKKKKTWILPGGKPENENDFECLYREIKDELNVKAIIKNYYASFIGETPHKKDTLEARVYFGKIKGSIKPSAEISDAEFINDFENYWLSDITKKIIYSLKSDGYLT